MIADEDRNWDEEFGEIVEGYKQDELDEQTLSWLEKQPPFLKAVVNKWLESNPNLEKVDAARAVANAIPAIYEEADFIVTMINEFLIAFFEDGHYREYENVTDHVRETLPKIALETARLISEGIVKAQKYFADNVGDALSRAMVEENFFYDALGWERHDYASSFGKLLEKHFAIVDRFLEEKND